MKIVIKCSQNLSSFKRLLLWHIEKLGYVILLVTNIGCNQVEDRGYIDKVNPHYLDPYRPQIHYSRDTGWLSDPNGLFYQDGDWHLMFQGFSNREGMYQGTNWDHAKSKDLLHWRHMPTALETKKDYRLSYYSGCAVVDKENVSGLSNNGSVPILAFYTTAFGNTHPSYTPKHNSLISIAHSLDHGDSWSYGDRHAIKETKPHERDPSVFWHKASKQWIMATAGTGHIRFYSSINMLDWNFESQALPFPSWECPDLNIMKVVETGEEKVVLITSTNGGVPNSTHGTCYHVGTFDGHLFSPEDTSDTKHWLDWGSDFYAGITFSNAPENRILFQSWFGWPCQWNKLLSRTSKFSGTMNLIRELTLHINSDSTYYLYSNPIDEYKRLRIDSTIMENLTVSGGYTLKKNIGSHEPLEINFSAKFKEGAIWGIRLKNDFGEDYVFHYDDWHKQFIADRTNAGTLPGHYSGAYKRLSRMPYKAQDQYLKIQVFFDVSTFEAFIDDGREAFSALVYPREPFTTLELFSLAGNTEFELVKIYELKSIWIN